MPDILNPHEELQNIASHIGYHIITFIETKQETCTWLPITAHYFLSQSENPDRLFSLKMSFF